MAENCSLGAYELEKKSRVKVDTVMLVGLLGSSADYEASFDVPSLFAGRMSNVGPPGISGTLLRRAWWSRHGNLMLDALSMATLMRRNRWMRTETASAQSSEALGGPDAIGRVVDVRRCAGAQAVMTGSVRKWPVMRPALCGVWDRRRSSPVRGLKLLQSS